MCIFLLMCRKFSPGPKPALTPHCAHLWHTKQQLKISDLGNYQFKLHTRNEFRNDNSSSCFSYLTQDWCELQSNCFLLARSVIQHQSTVIIVLYSTCNSIFLDILHVMAQFNQYLTLHQTIVIVKFSVTCRGGVRVTKITDFSSDGWIY
jgi:hypothetical protein